MSISQPDTDSASHYGDRHLDIGLLDIAIELAENWVFILVGSLVVGLSALGATYFLKPVYTATTTLLPPQQQQQSVTAATLNQLSALAGLAGSFGGTKTPGDLYVALLKSETIQDQLVDRYDLMTVYDVEYRFEARRELSKNVDIALGRKDGIIQIQVDDNDPTRAADLANSHVDELQRLTNRLAVTEAQERRVFFEKQLDGAKQRLTQAQQALQASGFGQGALRAEPKASAEGYARLKAEATAAEVRLQAMRKSFNENAPEVQQLSATLAALRSQLARTEQALDPQSGADYISKYRDFKYEETLFELFARQYELARADEAREGAMIQVVDTARVPEWKSKPERLKIGAIAAGVTFVALIVFVVGRLLFRMASAEPEVAGKIERLSAAFGNRRTT